MKTYRSTIMAAIAATGLVSVSCAAPGEDGPAGKPRGGHGPFGDRPTSVVLEIMTKRLELTEAQREKIAPILNEAKEKIKKSVEESKDALESTKQQISAELTEAQKTKLEEGKGILAGAMGGYLRDHGPELRQRVEGAGKEIGLRAALGALELTEEQREKLKELQERAQEKRETLMQEMKPKFEEIEKDVKDTLAATLTPEQLEKLKAQRANLPGAGKHGRFGGDH